MNFIAHEWSDKSGFIITDGTLSFHLSMEEIISQKKSEQGDTFVEETKASLNGGLFTTELISNNTQLHIKWHAEKGPKKIKLNLGRVTLELKDKTYFTTWIKDSAVNTQKLNVMKF